MPRRSRRRGVPPPPPPTSPRLACSTRRVRGVCAARAVVHSFFSSHCALPGRLDAVDSFRPRPPTPASHLPIPLPKPSRAPTQAKLPPSVSAPKIEAEPEPEARTKSRTKPKPGASRRSLAPLRGAARGAARRHGAAAAPTARALQTPSIVSFGGPDASPPSPAAVPRRTRSPTRSHAPPRAAGSRGGR